jgi:phenylacetate-CoA ligase
MTVTDSTCLERELTELRRWTLRPRHSNARQFEQLVIHEFQSTDEHHARQAAALAKLVRFATEHVPYYGDVFRKRALSPDSIRSPDDLPHLPILTKRDVIEHGRELRAEHLPPGEGPPITYESTGTTGQPVKIIMSRASSAMFALLWHRQARWFRYDPARCFAKVRVPSTLPRQRDGSAMPPDIAMRRTAWMYVGAYFHTGPEIVFSVASPMQKQIAWLKRFRPDYLLTYPGVFEELAMACEGATPVDSLKSLLGIGSNASPSMRTWIERTYAVPLQQNYGLNEVGLVAIRCPAGRYHVNTEHCVVEIVDGEGRPVPPGASGHLLVTALQNIAMPLIRYDTGDIAVAAEGPCPCGRTLPCFGEIVGRYRRYAGLPPHTRERLQVLLHAFEEIPPEFVRNLRRYQIYQNREDHFEVRLRTAGPLPPEFSVFLRERWAKAGQDPAVPLTITEGAHIVTSPGGKLLDFDSAFYSSQELAERAHLEDNLTASLKERD